MGFIDSENFGKNQPKNLRFIAEKRRFLRFFGPDRAYPDFTVNLELVSGKCLSWSKSW